MTARSAFQRCAGRWKMWSITACAFRRGRWSWRRRRGYDRGFVVSDHADWPGLLRSIEDSQASRIYVTHGDGEALIHHLRDLGRDAQPLSVLRGADGESGG